MKRFGNPLLSFAAPCLILIALVGLLHREGRERIQSLPAFFVGFGLICASSVRRTRRRKLLLDQISHSQDDDLT